MSRRRAIPDPVGPDMRFQRAVKERLEIVCGESGTPIAMLDTATATTAQIAAKVKELILLLQPRKP